MVTVLESLRISLSTPSRPFRAYTKACLHPVVNRELGAKADGGCSATGSSALLPALAGWALLLARRRRREGGRR